MFSVVKVQCRSTCEELDQYTPSLCRNFQLCGLFPYEEAEAEDKHCEEDRQLVSL